MDGNGLICVLGDAHLDVVVCPSGPIARESDTPARTWVGAGGQGANVAAWICALGGRSRLITVRGNDLASALVSADLQRRGVQVAGPVVDGPTGVVVSLSENGDERSMLTDRGAGGQLAEADIDPAWLGDCALLHVSGYVLAGAGADAALAVVRKAPRLSLDLSSTAVLRAFGVARFRDVLAEVRPDIVFGTEAEADLVGDLPAGCDLVVKRGARGVLAAGVEYPALPVPAGAVDSTGAGDAFAAGYLLGGVRLGLDAAARAVATMGAMP